MKYIVVCAERSKYRPEFYEAMSYGQPKTERLQRGGGPVAIFKSKEEAKKAINETQEACKGMPWLKVYILGTLACEEIE